MFFRLSKFRLLNARTSNLRFSRQKGNLLLSKAEGLFSFSLAISYLILLLSPLLIPPSGIAGNTRSGANTGAGSAAARDALAEASASGHAKGQVAGRSEEKVSFQRFKLSDEQGKDLSVSNLLQVDKDIYLLASDRLYLLKNLAGSTQEEKALKAQEILVPGGKVKGVPIQEFLCFCYFRKHKSIAVLDKSGSIFEFFPGQANEWHLLFANKRDLGSPDPHYVSMCCDGERLFLLDPERNQIWRFPFNASRSNRLFKDVLPWRIKAGDPNVTDGVALDYDPSSDSLYLLRSSGTLSIYKANVSGGSGNPRKLTYKIPAKVSPTRLTLSDHSPCFIVERENSRVLAVDKQTGKSKEYIFPQGSDLRGLLAGYGGFCVIDGSSLVFRMLAENDAGKPLQMRALDLRLAKLQIPIRSAHLPRHPGVFPGARRLYRHGVHQGLDFFDDPGAGTRVSVNTPAVASACGKVIRADTNYKDMDAKEYSRVMSDCARSQYCSEANEDLFRGCQVWLDHGGGLITRYAHLNKARADLKEGMTVSAGETIGYIGYSGTGENQPGRLKHPHLHFEIWLDGHYLGYGLSPAETISLYRKVFSTNAKRKGH